MKIQIPIKTSKKWGVIRIPTPDKPIIAVKTPSGVTVIPLSETKRMGLYNTIDNLLKAGKMTRYNANGTPKLTDKKTKVFIDLNEFEMLQEF